MQKQKMKEQNNRNIIDRKIDNYRRKRVSGNTRGNTVTIPTSTLDKPSASLC